MARKLRIEDYKRYKGRERIEGTRFYRDKESRLFEEVGELEYGEGMRLIKFRHAGEIRRLTSGINAFLAIQYLGDNNLFRQNIDEANLTYTIRRVS